MGGSTSNVNAVAITSSPLCACLKLSGQKPPTLRRKSCLRWISAALHCSPAFHADNDNSFLRLFYLVRKFHCVGGGACRRRSRFQASCGVLSVVPIAPRAPPALIFTPWQVSDALATSAGGRVEGLGSYPKEMRPMGDPSSRRDQTRAGRGTHTVTVTKPDLLTEQAPRPHAVGVLVPIIHNTRI